MKISVFVISAEGSKSLSLHNLHDYSFKQFFVDTNLVFCATRDRFLKIKLKAKSSINKFSCKKVDESDYE